MIISPQHLTHKVAIIHGPASSTHWIIPKVNITTGSPLGHCTTNKLCGRLPWCTTPYTCSFMLLALPLNIQPRAVIQRILWSSALDIVHNEIFWNFPKRRPDGCSSSRIPSLYTAYPSILQATLASLLSQSSSHTGRPLKKTLVSSWVFSCDKQLKKWRCHSVTLLVTLFF